MKCPTSPTSPQLDESTLSYLAAMIFGGNLRRDSDRTEVGREDEFSC